MGLRLWIVALIAGLAAALPARAETTSNRIYAHKAWTVEVVAYDNGTVACVASVSAPGESFSIWAYSDATFGLQFYSTQWLFDGGTANLQLQIDRRAPWNLADANLNQNSVLFTIPSSQAGNNFLIEVARGNVLYLRTEFGQPVQSYTLAGSLASMRQLIDCAETLQRGVNPANPFR